MAVQKSRKTRSRRDMRRSHDALQTGSISVEQETGETHRRHHISDSGFYRGKQWIVAKDVQDDFDDESEDE